LRAALHRLRDHLLGTIEISIAFHRGFHLDQSGFQGNAFLCAMNSPRPGSHTIYRPAERFRRAIEGRKLPRMAEEIASNVATRIESSVLGRA
jgi:hypothetical protein